ncbi:aminotransferase class IV [Corynebacterium sp. HS2168-gen11]|uniref:aminotransferase class IV n=1 Tax=Corynebacterium sp. HS2168-gen11 TaxID=2974027 RepID=UPI00216ACF29|nr:aminotransferase class IV [Corynebacterium sp. HS2168-gen11]MCS4534972.1 aminotransferase class IV [Corynebacterium sp. HS2168-gen11]
MRTIIDSFALRNGSIRGLELHLARFRGTIARIGGNVPTVADLMEPLPATGMWFPQWSYDIATATTSVQLRELPPPRLTTALWQMAQPDQRQRPEYKGWDLHYQRQQVAQAHAHGCDDLVLCTAQGTVIEAGFGALVWYRDGRWQISAHPHLPSITVALTAEVCGALEPAVCSIQDLRTIPVAYGNARLGWTPVTRIGAYELPAHTQWQELQHAYESITATQI